jgi:dolichol kinase
MEMRLHRGGRWRSWLGARFGGDAALGDRVWRRCLHLFGVAVLLYYLLPVQLAPWLSTEEVLLAALAMVIVLEIARHTVGVDLPTLREHEEHRVASYTWFAIGLVVAVLLFPRPIAVAAVLGTALVDPLIGELRLSPARRRWYPAGAGAVYAGLALASFAFVGRWATLPSVAMAVVMTIVALLVESPKLAWLDDDLTMTLVPGALATAVLFFAPGFPTFVP